MTAKAALLTAACALTLLPATAGAQLVYIHATGGAADQEGRGIAMRGNGRCHILAPAHVVDGQEEITVWGQGRVSSGARVTKAFNTERGAAQLDLAILELDDGSKIRCDDPLPQAKQVSDALKKVSAVIIQRVDKDGNLTNSRALAQGASPASLMLEPDAGPRHELHTGDSGSIVYYPETNTPVAMLVSEEGDGLYAAIPLDLVTSVANTYFASQRAPVRAFQFTRFDLTQPPTAMPGGGRGDNGRLLLTAQELRSETDRLLAGTKGFPQVDNNAGPDQISVAGDMVVTAVALETVRNSCSRRNNKLLGMNVPVYEARDAGSICYNGFGEARSLMRFTFRLNGQVREGTAGAVVPIIDQFQLVLPAETGQANLILATELSHRICARTNAAVTQLTPGAKPKKGGLGTPIFGNANLIVPNLENPKLRTGC